MQHQLRDTVRSASGALMRQTTERVEAGPPIELVGKDEAKLVARSRRTEGEAHLGREAVAVWELGGQGGGVQNKPVAAGAGGVENVVLFVGSVLVQPRGRLEAAVRDGATAGRGPLAEAHRPASLLATYLSVRLLGDDEALEGRGSLLSRCVKLSVN